MKALKLTLLMTIGLLMVACEGNGPATRQAVPQKEIDEVVHDVLAASSGDGWLYQYASEVYYNEDGEWYYGGIVDVYTNLKDDNESRLWCDFDGSGNLMPTYNTSRGGYTYEVQYHGIYYYF